MLEDGTWFGVESAHCWEHEEQKDIYGMSVQRRLWKTNRGAYIQEVWKQPDPLSAWSLESRHQIAPEQALRWLVGANEADLPEDLVALLEGKEI